MTTTNPESAVRYRLARLGRWHNGLALVTIAIAGVAWSAVPAFGTEFNLSQAIAGTAEVALMVLPLTLLVVAGDIDLSVASVAGVAGMVAGMALDGGMASAPAIALALLAGAACGAFNGLMVTVFRLPSLVVTLGTLALFRGICYGVMGQESLFGFSPPWMTDLGSARVPGTWLPMAIVPFVVLAVGFVLVLHRMSTGRRIFTIGAGMDVARYSGVGVARLRFGLFVVSGTMSALAGLVYLCRVDTARADNLLTLELIAVTAVFLGGVSPFGGRGSYFGVLWALALVATINSVLGLKNVVGDEQASVIGLILITALLARNGLSKIADARRQRREIESFRRRRAKLRGEEPQ